MLTFKKILDFENLLVARNIVESEWPAKERIPTIPPMGPLVDMLDDKNIGIYIGSSSRFGTPVVSGSLYVLPTFRNGFSCVAQIENLVVLPQFRGHGFGKQMVYYLVEAAKKMPSVYKVVLNCSDENVQFYERCGFHRHENQMRLDLW